MLDKGNTTIFGGEGPTFLLLFAYFDNHIKSQNGFVSFIDNELVRYDDDSNNNNNNNNNHNDNDRENNDKQVTILMIRYQRRRPHAALHPLKPPSP